MKKMVCVVLIALLSLGVGNRSVMAWELHRFYSNVWSIGFAPVRLVWANTLNGFTPAAFAGYLNHATTQWAAAGINTFGVDAEHDATIKVLGGTRAVLEERQPAVRNRDGVAVISKIPDGTRTHQGQTIQNYRITRASVYVPQQEWWRVIFGWSANHYRNVFTHELGHALGWFGHSFNSSDVMYGVAGPRPNLTERDRIHLSQNYR